MHFPVSNSGYSARKLYGNKNNIKVVIIGDMNHTFRFRLSEPSETCLISEQYSFMTQFNVFLSKK